MSCVECGCAVHCNECKADLCAEHDRALHSFKLLRQHQRGPVAHAVTSAPAADSSDNSGSGGAHRSSNGSGSSSNSAASAAAALVSNTATAASASDAAVPSSRYVGQHDEQGRAHGFGCEVDAAGKMIDGRCGVWNHGLLLDAGAVPLSLMPDDLFCEERARGALLLRSTGEWYRGGLDSVHHPHGDGCLFYADGRVLLSGSFEHNQLSNGFAEWPEGHTYDGQWKDGKPHGEGKIFRKSTGVIEEGTWSEGKFVSGKRTFPHGEVQQGTFLDGLLHGPACIVVWPNGDRHEGAMHHGVRNGVGTYEWKVNGDRYEGEWRDGQRTGVGRFVWKSGTVHAGEFANNKITGLGVQRSEDGRIAGCGTWKDGQFVRPCPVPRSSLPAGAMPHADDTLVFSDGSTFRSPLDEQNQPHGAGSTHLADGRLEASGLWVHGKLHGPVRMDAQPTSLRGLRA